MKIQLVTTAVFSKKIKSDFSIFAWLRASLIVVESTLLTKYKPSPGGVLSLTSTPSSLPVTTNSKSPVNNEEFTFKPVFEL